MAAECVIEVSEGGRVRFLWDDTLAGLLQEGEAVITRASQVEPQGTRWIADLAPVSGPVLGPFDLRQDALDAEREWLETHLFGGKR